MKQDYRVQLNNGMTIELGGANIEVEQFTKTLNNREVTFVNLGGAIISKNIIVAVLPVSNEYQPTN